MKLFIFPSLSLYTYFHLFIESSEEQTEALVETLNIEGATLTETNLSNLSSSDIQTLTELSQDLTLTNEMETEGEFNNM